MYLIHQLLELKYEKFGCINDSMTHSYLTCFNNGWISVFERISNEWFTITNTFFNSHLSPPSGENDAIDTNVIWSASCFQKTSGSILIATIDINDCSRTINFYPSISMNDCKTEIILCSWKDCLWSFFLPKHVNCLLSGSAAARMQIWMFRYDFFKVLIDTGESLSFRN